jgi:malate dehydrogenase (oxaloacetate-decarboxylating)(NADP+)
LSLHGAKGTGEFQGTIASADARSATRQPVFPSISAFCIFKEIRKLLSPGKTLEIRATRAMKAAGQWPRPANGRDRAPIRPGVAEACLEIKADPANAARYTARGNLVAVVSNGTAVLGLGNIGALASKPVMEGKAVLFKKFANIDCFDIEVNESDPEKLADIVCALEPTFGAINLEDIKAPDCFIVERSAESG